MVDESMVDEKPPSRELRRRFEQEYALPLARAMFELEPRCQSVLVTVGQYWCDEATDAVHAEVLACTEREPPWPEAAQLRAGAIGEPQLLAEYLKEAERSLGEEPAGLGDVQWELNKQANLKAFGQEYFAVLDENSDMIVAFASHCREVSDQEQPRWRSHTPYGVIRRPADGEPPVFEVIGQMHRPEWEDRWDVLEKDGLISGWQDGPVEPVASTGESGRPSAEAVPGKPAASASSTYRVLLFLLFIAAIIAVRACLGR